MTTMTTLTDREAERRDALVGRLFQTFLDTFEAFTIHIGDRLGLYRAVAESGSATAPAIAARTGTYQRYTREWLEQQTVAGILMSRTRTPPRTIDATACHRDTRRC